jgi:hypothetical protein
MSKEQLQLVLVGVCVVAGIAVVVAHPWLGLIAGGVLGWTGIKRLVKIARDYAKEKACNIIDTIVPPVTTFVIPSDIANNTVSSSEPEAKI